MHSGRTVTAPNKTPEKNHQDSWMIQEGEVEEKRGQTKVYANNSRNSNSAASERVTSRNISGAELNAREKIVSSARNHLGVPYKYGGNGPSAFDCSGFTRYCMRDIGVELARNSTHQSRQGKKIKINQAKTGDLVFFGRGSKIEHVGIVMEKNARSLYVIHASTSKGVIIEDVLSSRYWKPRILYAVDIVGTADYDLVTK